LETRISSCFSEQIVTAPKTATIILMSLILFEISWLPDEATEYNSQLIIERSATFNLFPYVFIFNKIYFKRVIGVYILC
jgi:hypothetical protein